MWQKKKLKMLKLPWYKYVWYKQKAYEINDVETIIDNDGMFWLNEKQIEEGLNRKNLREITVKPHLDHREQKYEIVTESKKPSITNLD